MAFVASKATVRRVLICGCFFLAAEVVTVGPCGAAPAAERPFVMMISIDGLKPEAVLEAPQHGLAVPNLRRFLAEGTYASAVRGVLPSLTYPSHVTLLTGVSPAEHGIYANTTFDPLNRNERGWYWYTEDVRVETLWDAAAAAHLRTASVYWPVSVGAHITYNLPQIWRAGTEDDLKLQRAVGTPGLEKELSAVLGRFPGGMEETVAQDEIRMRFALRLLRTKHPDFMTIYMTGLDTEQHKTGPFSPAANAALERIDAQIGLLRAAAFQAAPGHAVVCVVSDHGFARVDHDVSLYSAFHAAGLFDLDEHGKITAWRAMPWPGGGTAAVMLADPADAEVRSRVAALLEGLAGDPANGIDRILGHEELERRGGFPDAQFLVAFRSGFELGYELTGPLIVAPANGGMHGYLPDEPQMKASFFLAGPGVPMAVNLGEIDMRRIAPTIAAILGVKLARADLPPLPLQTSGPAR